MTEHTLIDLQLEKYNVCKNCNHASPTNCNNCDLQSVTKYIEECGNCNIRQASSSEIEEILNKVGKCKN